MDLRDHLLALLGDALPGASIGEATLVDASTELGLRLTFLVGGQLVHVEVARTAADGPARPHAARTERLLFGYRSGSGDAVDPRIGLALCLEVAGIARRHEARVLAAIERDAAAAREAGDATMRIREVHVRRMLERAGTREQPYFTLSPYVGCLVGCRFCYAQERVAEVRRLEQLADVPWGSYVDVRVDAALVLGRELDETAPAPLKFCPIVSDPYQAVEARYGITRACLQAIRDAPGVWPTFVLTRTRLIERDAELIGSLAAGYGGMSIPTLDDAARAHFEPRATSVAERLAVLRTLRAAGARTFAVVQPLLPGPTTALADALAETVGSVSIDVLHGTYGASREFAHPTYACAADPMWQREHKDALAEALRERGVVVWDGELPPDVSPEGRAPDVCSERA